MTTQKLKRLACDRCGAVSELLDDGVHRGWQTIGSPCPDGGFIGFGEIPPIADLCPDCRTSLIQWWREKHPLKGFSSARDSSNKGE
jgi:hypothetical protein